MLTIDSEVKVIDFGLAKAITDAGGENGPDARRIRRHTALRTRAGGGLVDVCSDIYSFGVGLGSRSLVRQL